MSEEILQRLYKRLQVTPMTRGTVGPFDLEIQYMPTKHELFYATSVFHGGNYVPDSVRGAVRETGVFAQAGGSDCRLFIDEVAFQVVLAYRVAWSTEDEKAFHSLTADFLAMAEEWRLLLDEYGDQDLIRVPTNP